MEHKILLAGFGGQGVMVIGQLLTYAGFSENKEVVYLPAYGGEQRGGTANCTVILSDEPIGSPNVRRYDTVVALNEPSLVKYGPSVKDGGNLILNTDLITTTTVDYPAKVFCLPAVTMAEEIGSARSANIVILGLLAKLTGMVTMDGLTHALHAKLGGKPEFMVYNEKALASGFNFTV